MWNRTRAISAGKGRKRLETGLPANHYTGRSRDGPLVCCLKSEVQRTPNRLEEGSGALVCNVFLNTTSLRGSPDAFVAKSVCDHVLRLIDVSKINNDRARHRALQSVQIQRTELLPLGHDYQCVGAIRATIWTVAIADFR